MPRKIDPSKIKTGAGLAASDSIEGNAFVGTSISTSESNTLGAHINDPVDAHDASAVSIDGKPSGIFDTDNVEGALDELSGLVPPRPPTVGNKKTYMTFTGVPDWGVLKLADSGLTDRGILSALGNVDAQIYPYFHEQPKTLWLNEPTPRGADIQSDSIFNVQDATYRGGGFGQTFSGGFNRNNTHTIESFNMYQTIGSAWKVLISGSLFPADRGTLGVFYIPEGGTITDIECLAAINCGQGILDECDGKVGGIFTIATNDDIYDYPSAATGQYDLSELHTGYVRGTNVTITSVLNSAGLAGVTCASPHGLTIGEQIYIQGCDAVPDINGYQTVTSVVNPNEFLITPTGAITTNGTTGTVGISLTPSGFDPSNADNSAGQVRLGYTILGGTSVSAAPTDATFVDGRNDNNFFRYRLPYLEKYDQLIYTPENQQPRYFEKPPISDNPSTDLDLAGNYDGFTKDYWTFQLSRYRHQFELPYTAGASEKGALLMIHFKKEANFENLVVDKVAPLNDEVYSANLINWSDIESTDNMYKTTAEGHLNSADSYHVLKSRLFEDDDGTITPTISGSYVLSRTIDQVVYVSGVAYFKPHPSEIKPLQLEELNFSINDLFDNTFRTGQSSDSNEITEALRTADPSFVWMGSYGESLSVPTEDHGRGNLTRRAEIKYSLLGAFDLSNPPTAGAVGVFNAPAGSHYVVQGDNISPRFCSNVQVRTFARRPLLHDSLNYVEGNTLSEIVGDTIMVHSTGTGATALYSPDSIKYSSQKDYEERFLDENYRWIGDFPTLVGAGAVTSDEYDRLIGAGLPSVGAIDFPVRPTSIVAFQNASFVVQNRHENPLDTVLLTTPEQEAQVCGLPDRNSPLSDGVRDPMPSRGLLKYPQNNYSTGHRPSVARGDMSAYAQPDYSGLTGNRQYVRAFDLAFSRDANPLIEAIGSSFFKIRIHGLQLEDFAWSGGASAGSDAIAIFVKLAGLTTWMDIGRLDGSGASKQDAFSDGAGCQVNDPTETKNGVDSKTGIVYADVLIHTGTSASIYENSQGEAPVLVKVVIKDTAAGKALNFEQGGADGTVANVRGLVGLEILRPE